MQELLFGTIEHRLLYISNDLSAEEGQAVDVEFEDVNGIGELLLHSCEKLPILMKVAILAVWPYWSDFAIGVILEIGGALGIEEEVGGQESIVL